MFKKYADSLGVDVEYEECVGGHEWRLWNLWIKKFIDIIGQYTYGINRYTIKYL